MCEEEGIETPQKRFDQPLLYILCVTKARTAAKISRERIKEEVSKAIIAGARHGWEMEAGDTNKEIKQFSSEYLKENGLL